MITEHIQLILLVSGVATMGASVQFLAPRLILKLLYEVEPSEPTILLLAKHWGLLIFLVGALLVYSAYDSSTRDPVLVVATLEKIVFAGFIFLGPVKKTSVGTFVAAGDTSFVVLYLLYFLGF
ncbi:hypothetical protein [Candidatus Nitrospira neomarina]|uniref:Uncharacterized protein n=1 Tax=Candidatus Nitrospira neomarina TaxID=3020899 RepID=A0AA96GKY7_9BACT|nr:hypothetical protein [Candidatus Nitrospira neomarina]WNM62290.1 hypothetical protein PQG83_00675 [Candidatus Nitrospira neomarina]